MMMENICQAVSRLTDVLNAINSSTDVKAVVITSPTYDGVVSDIASISEICHKKGIPLIIDEAHGSPFCTA